MDDEFFDNLPERLQQFVDDKARIIGMQMKKKAFQDGEEQGVEKERRRIVTYLLQKGRTLDDVLEFIGMPNKD